MMLTGLMRSAILTGVCALLGVVAVAQDAKTAAYAKMAAVSEYLIADRNAEVELARSAAPPSVSRDAEVMVLGEKGYETAAKGSNGFVCIVERGFAAGTDFPEFWNPKLRSPNCFNREAAATYMQTVLRKAEWALDGNSKEQITEKVKQAVDSGAFQPPPRGAMCYMMSKEQYLNDQAVHWHPHLMFFMPLTSAAAWGADGDDSPVLADNDKQVQVTIFMVVLDKWSDGSPAPQMKM